MEDGDDSDDWDSGPYCQHLDAPSDCDVLCVCGHPCKEHDGDTGECRNENCKCAKFEDAPER